MAGRWIYSGLQDADGEATYDWVEDDPGVITYTDASGNQVASGGSGTGATSRTSGDTSTNWSDVAKSILGKAATPGGIAGLATSLYGAMGGNKPSTPPGWRGIIDPNAMTATQTQIAQPAYTPYSGQAVMGRRQLSDVAMTPKPVLAAGETAPAPAPFVGGYSAAAPPAAVAPVSTPAPAPAAPAGPTRQQIFDAKMASQYAPGHADGGLMGLAHGGRYLQGHTDGMADKINTDIDGKQAAKLSHGEFVIPADVVSHLGNGNSDAGANVLYKMMDRIRTARTGNRKQGKQINPEKFMPGGLASLPAYADGGAVAFKAGDIVLPTTQESNLSSWAGPGVADYINRGTALSKQPYQAYTGPLTAGVSPLQQQAFNAASNLQTPASMGQAATTAGNVASEMGGLGYNPVGSDFNAAAAQKYMNPYLQASLDPQIAEARRQSQISQMGNAAQATKAGAFGGSRGALMDTETQRNLGTNLANITGQGYNTAYNNAQQQFNTDQTRRIGENQFGTNFGLQALQGQLGAAQAQGQLGSMQSQTGLANLAAQTSAGATQRGIEQEGISALHDQFNLEQADPLKKVQYAQSLYQGLPTSTVTASTSTTPLQTFGQAAGQGSDVAASVDKFLNPKP